MEPKNRDLFRLLHMIESIDKIMKIVEISKDFSTFETKWIEQDAMIRNFEILGEASNNISIETKEKYNEVEWYKIRGMRNFMTHEYFGIKLEVIWDTAIKDIPELRSKIEYIMSDIKSS